MSDTKKPWSKPELIVLGKGTPEENVLVACKAVVSCTQTLSPS